MAKDGMSNRLAGRTALITGAGRGIGQHVAARFAGEGARVVFADRDLAAADAAADAFPDAIAVGMDISDEGSVAAGFAAVTAHGWEIDVVVANAGVQLFGQDAKIADLDLDVWNRTVAINLTGTFLTVKHAVRAMLDDGRAVKGGSIILTGSPTGLNGEGAVVTAYSSTKAGMHGMARTVAAAIASQNCAHDAKRSPGAGASARVKAFDNAPRSTPGIDRTSTGRSAGWSIGRPNSHS